MSDMEFQNKIRSLAQGMSYPRTPDVAGSVTARIRSSTRPRFSSRTLAWSLTILLVLGSSLMLIPSVRAAVMEVIKIGVVRIFPQPVTPTVEPVVTASPLIDLLDKLAGETTLEDAQKTAGYPIQIPTYPPGLQKPDRVYVQDVQDGNMTVLVWLDPQDPNQVALSLHFIPSGSWAIKKMQPRVIQETQVNNHRAIWAEGPYLLILKNEDIERMRLIEGHVLIWEDGDVTYRLETRLPLDEAIRIAESLHPFSTP